MKMKLLAVIGASLLIAILMWSALEHKFTYRYKNFPPARSPSLMLELKQFIGLDHFYSQFGQDKWIIGKIFPGVNNGYFVDVGSGDGIMSSNSKALEDLGWNGVAVDPFPKNWRTRKCLLFKEVVYSQKGLVVEFRLGRDFGGIDQHIQRWKNKVKRNAVVKLVTTTIGDILERANAPAFIHYISLDTEGSEYEILKAFPFAKYRVGALTIEHNFEEPKRRQIRELLESNGYRLERQQVVEDWYVLQDRWP